MKIKNLLKFVCISGTFILGSCSSDDDSTPPVVVEAPATYVFERNNESSISFGGQTTRIAMAEENYK